jgi:hypothetical protein
MDGQADVKSLYERVERLERQNRWMKRMGVAAILSAGVLLVSGQAKVDTKKTVDANEFVLKDTNGVVRAKLGMGVVLMTKGPGLVLYDDRAQQMATFATSDEEARIYLGSSGSIPNSTSSSIWAGVPGKDGSGVGITGPSGVVRMNLDGMIGGPQIGLLDKEGYETNIGKTDLVSRKTGKTEQTSAASVVMFDTEKKVLWSAP